MDKKKEEGIEMVWKKDDMYWGRPVRHQLDSNVFGGVISGQRDGSGIRQRGRLEAAVPFGGCPSIVLAAEWDEKNRVKVALCGEGLRHVGVN